MKRRASTPWHYWPVATLSLLWSVFGGLDFVMTNIRDPFYLAQLPPAMVDWLDEMPVWAIGVWALGVWGAVLASLLLLVRSRFAVHAFAASLTGLAVSTIHQVATSAPVGPAAMVVAIWVIAVFLMAYSVRIRRRGVLR